MIKSMTGFGKATAETPQKKITVEIKSWNSRQLDISAKLPWLLREKEPEIRNFLGQKLERGKIDLVITYDLFDSEFLPVVNKAAVMNYFRQLSEISSSLGIEAGEASLAAILRLPEALKTDRQELPEEEWNMLMNLLEQAVNELDRYRTDEGAALEKDMRQAVNRILGTLSEVEKFEEARITKIREKLITLLNENIPPEKIDRNRFEQEIIYYLEKLDINEEKVRLRQHCGYFLENLSSPVPSGKMLGFIAQEIGREINTIGSKANDASIQKLVVIMKDDLEKIKEQILNVL